MYSLNFKGMDKEHPLNVTKTNKGNTDLYFIQLLSYKFLQKDTTKRSKSFAFLKTRDFSFN